MLIALGGLPGTGKTTVGKLLAARYTAAYLRIDEIEQALRRRACEVGPAGYAVAQAIARSNLELGLWVVADSVNPVPASREGWREAARHAGRAILEVEIVCSDVAEHRRRVESRAADVEGLQPPTWASVQAHDYAAWTEPRLVLDTARLSPADTVDAIAARLRAMSTEAPNG